MRWSELREYGETWDKGSYGDLAELVPVTWLEKLKGNDLRVGRGKINTGYNPDVNDWEYSDKLEDLARTMKERGIQEPLIIIVGKKDRYARIGEGNHRIAAAKMAGIDELPARVIVWQNGKGAQQYAHYVGDDLLVPEEGYFPSDASPSQVFKSLARRSE